jgi:hypothetical protein
MSYRIEYDCGAGKYEVREEADIFPWILAAFGIFLLLTFCFWTEGASVLKEILIPGEDMVTIQAFSAMTDDLRSGATILDAVESFCKAVIHGK